MSQTKVNVGMIDASSIGDAKVLQGNGAWITPSAGALTFINTSDISAAATYDFTAFNSSSYDSYVLNVMNLIPVTDDVSLDLLTSTDGGSSYDSSSGNYAWMGFGGETNTQSGSDNSIWMNGSTASNSYRFGSAANEDGGSFALHIMSPHLTKRTMFHWEGSFFSANDTTAHLLGCGARLSSADVDAIRLVFSSGNIESGTITAYGVANA